MADLGGECLSTVNAIMLIKLLLLLLLLLLIILITLMITVVVVVVLLLIIMILLLLLLLMIMMVIIIIEGLGAENRLRWRGLRRRPAERRRGVVGKGQMRSALIIANLLFFDRDLLGTPVNLLLPSQKCQGVPFSPICRNSLLLQRPISADPICPQPRWHPTLALRPGDRRAVLGGADGAGRGEINI